MMKNKSEIVKVLEILKKSQTGVRKTTLNREGKETKNFTPYETLISCLLSLRAKDEVTEIISKNLFKIANTPEKILQIPENKLKKIIFSSGHFNKKAEAIRHVSKELIERFHSKVPDTYEQLISIKHIGPKTANIVLCFSFDKIVIPVDVNVHRVSNRLGWVNTQTAEKTEKELEKVLPKNYWRDLNGIFILHGKSICVPVSPKCSICPVKKYCPKIGVKKSR